MCSSCVGDWQPSTFNCTALHCTVLENLSVPNNIVVQSHNLSHYYEILNFFSLLSLLNLTKGCITTLYIWHLTLSLDIWDLVTDYCKVPRDVQLVEILPQLVNRGVQCVVSGGGVTTCAASLYWRIDTLHPQTQLRVPRNYVYKRALEKKRKNLRNTKSWFVVQLTRASDPTVCVGWLLHYHRTVAAFLVKSSCMLGERVSRSPALTADQRK